MQNINQSPEETKKPKFRQLTPEEQTQEDEMVRQMLKEANENAKAGRWPSERQK